MNGPHHLPFLRGQCPANGKTADIMLLRANDQFDRIAILDFGTNSVDGRIPAHFFSPSIINLPL
jgi:hypothetical protein